jgi:FMN reductase (NADPH)
MNPTIQLLKKHVSVRNFKHQKISKKEVETLVEAAQSASTASFLQAYSIISIDDEDLLEKIVEKGKLQSFILEAGHFFIFCGDFRRHADLAAHQKIDISGTLEGIDALMVGAIDASLAAQNLVIAAESLGMGVCYIGGVRDGIEAISEVLDLPEYVFPIYGLVLGYPAKINDRKPRFPRTSIHHYNGYSKETLEKTKEYEEMTADYYFKRDSSKGPLTWSSTAFKSLLSRPRKHMKAFLNKQGLAKK